MTSYTPELGQAVFGQPSQSYECPRWLIELLEGIERQLEDYCTGGHTRWQGKRLVYSNPFRNYGPVRFDNGVFVVEGYSWDESYEQPFNFEHGDIRLSWYKHVGRGASANRAITPDEGVALFQACMESLELPDEFGDDSPRLDCGLVELI